MSSAAHPKDNRNVILVVEDDPPLRELYRAALVAAGYAVFAVEDGVDALRFVEARTPAAVVLDLGLPRLHGRDVHREMAAQGLTQQVPVVVVTGSPDDINEAEFSCVLRKPIRPDDLVNAVRRCLGGPWSVS
jgi:DNA-binding response OmpR family regulator